MARLFPWGHDVKESKDLAVPLTYLARGSVALKWPLASCERPTSTRRLAGLGRLPRRMPCSMSSEAGKGFATQPW